MKRFLILTQYYPPEVGAAQVRLSAFARELCRAGHDVQVVTALPSYPSGTFEPSDRRRVVRREIVYEREESPRQPRRQVAAPTTVVKARFWS